MRSVSFVYHQRAITYISMGKYGRALADCAKALAGLKKTNRADVYATMASAYLGMKRYRRALRAIRTSLRLNPKNKRAWRLRGQFHAGHGRYTKALRDLSRALKLDPEYGIAYLARGSIHMKRKRFSEALADYKRAARFEPEKAEVYVQRARAFSALNKPLKASADIRRAMALGRRDAPTYAALGDYLVKAGKLRPGLAAYDTALSHDARLAPVHMKCGEIYLRLKQHRAALAAFTRAIRLKPRSSRAYYRRSIAHRRLGNRAQELCDLNASISLQPGGEPQRYVRRAEINSSRGRFGAARSDYARALKIEPGLAIARRKQLAMSLIPRVGLAAQVRYAYGVDGGLGGRTSVEATWHLARLRGSLSLGLAAGFAYTALPRHQLLDVSGGIALINHFKGSALSIDARAGYNVRTGGDDSTAPVRQGGMFSYGVQYRIQASRMVAIGASLTVQHDMKDPKRLSIMPGVELSFSPW